MLRLVVALMVVAGANCVSAQTGSVEGRVKLFPREDTEPKSNPQYPGQPGTVVAIPTNPVPAVVFMAEKFEGQTFKPPAKHPTLAQKNAWFIPEVMAVLVGTTVDFPNLDPQYHNVFSYSKPKRFDLGRYPTGESRPVTFDKLGVVKIYCEIHQHMQAFVIVCENPYFVVTDTDGRFRLDTLPIGKHKLMVWRARGKNLEREVEVIAGHTATVDFE